MRRSWLMYSKKEKRLNCICCKLFSKREYKLQKEGLCKGLEKCSSLSEGT
uniref:Transposase [Oryzias latipes] n=1 Tax=Lepeophtheirus salmonis TaxID=72036 RepID=A0A0K2UH72_LEPSM